MADGPRLTDSGRRTLAHLAPMLVAGGMTGRIVLDCNQGGVSAISEEITTRNGDGSRTIEVRQIRPCDLPTAP